MGWRISLVMWPGPLPPSQPWSLQLQGLWRHVPCRTGSARTPCAAPNCASTRPCFLAGMYQHLSLFYNERQLGPAYAKVASCTALAQVVGAPIAAAILAMDGAGGLKGW